MASASKLKKGGETNAENQEHPEDHNPEKESDHAQEEQEVGFSGHRIRWCPEPHRPGTPPEGSYGCVSTEHGLTGTSGDSKYPDQKGGGR